MNDSGKKSGCRKVFIGLLILTLLGVGIAGYLFYTATRTVEVTDEPLTEPEIALFKEKSEFLEALVKEQDPTPEARLFVNQTEATRQLEITQREIMHYVHEAMPKASNFMQNLQVTLHEDEARMAANIKVPEELGWNEKQAKLSGRITVEMDRENIDIRVTKVNLGAIPISNTMIKMFGGDPFLDKNLCEDLFQKDPEGLKDFLDKVENFRIEPGRVVLELRKKGS